MEGKPHPNQDWKARYAREDVPDPSHELIQLTEMYYENWESHQTFDGRKPVLVEQEYEVEIPAGILRGKIDALWWDERLGFYIVDHKFMKDADKQKSNQQMAVYSLLEPRAKHFFYEKVGLNNYKIQEVHNLAPALQKIEKTIQLIQKGEFVANPQPWFIPYCPFLDRCGKCLKGDDNEAGKD
jgi:hypothetical protein